MSSFISLQDSFNYHSVPLEAPSHDNFFFLATLLLSVGFVASFLALSNLKTASKYFMYALTGSVSLGFGTIYLSTAVGVSP